MILCGMDETFRKKRFEKVRFAQKMQQKFVKIANGLAAQKKIKWARSGKPGKRREKDGQCAAAAAGGIPCV